MNVNGTEIAQSVSVARYLAREFKLDGKNNVEKGQGDMIVDCVTDAFLEFLKEKFGKENNFKDEFYPKWLVMMDKLLTKNGGKHFVGKEVNIFRLEMNQVRSFLGEFGRFEVRSGRLRFGFGLLGNEP